MCYEDPLVRVTDWLKQETQGRERERERERERKREKEGEKEG